MKTPKEWREILTSGSVILESDIKAIQDEAFKAGLTRAAEIAENRHYSGSDSGTHSFLMGCKQAGKDILAEREKLP